MNFQLNEEQKLLQQSVKKMVDSRLRPIAAEVDSETLTSPKVVKILADAGLFALYVPKRYGGESSGEYSALPVCIVREELTRGCRSASGLFSVVGLGAYSIQVGGTEEQKEKYLPRIAKGKALPAFGLTEPDAGSDAGGMKTTAVVSGNDFVLNGTKCFISGANSADFIVIFAKTDPAKGTRGISAIIVEKGTPGMEVRHMGEFLSAHDIAEISLVNCRVPKSNLVGQLGAGLSLPLTVLTIMRTGVGAHGIGLAQEAFDHALTYAKTRQAFGQPIANFQLIQAKLADMATQIQAARLMVHWAAWLFDEGISKAIKEAAMAKLFATEMAQKVVHEAQQIFGGYGVVSAYPLEKLYRNVRTLTIVEGTSEIQRITIARQLLKN